MGRKQIKPYGYHGVAGNGGRLDKCEAALMFLGFLLKHKGTYYKHKHLFPYQMLNEDLFCARYYLWQQRYSDKETQSLPSGLSEAETHAHVMATIQKIKITDRSDQVLDSGGP